MSKPVSYTHLDVYKRQAQGFILHIGFVQQFAVHVDVAVPVDVHPLTGPRNHTFDQYLIIIVEGDDVAAFQLSGRCV